MSSPHEGPVWIIGLPGAGKSSVGRRLAARLGRPIVDQDRLIESRAGRTIAEIFRLNGEPAFRRLEAEAVAAVAGRRGAAPVVACGAGVVMRAASRRLLAARGATLWLDLPLAEALARCAAAGPTRPLLANRRAYRRRLARRLSRYRELGRRVDAAAPLAEVVERALEALRRSR